MIAPAGRPISQTGCGIDGAGWLRLRAEHPLVQVANLGLVQFDLQNFVALVRPRELKLASLLGKLKPSNSPVF